MLTLTNKPLTRTKSEWKQATNHTTTQKFMNKKKLWWYWHTGGASNEHQKSDCQMISDLGSQHIPDTHKKKRSQKVPWDEAITFLWVMAQKKGCWEQESNWGGSSWQKKKKTRYRYESEPYFFQTQCRIKFLLLLDAFIFCFEQFEPPIAL